MSGRRATPADVADRAAAAFAPSSRVRIGAEIEWLVFDRSDPTRRIDAADVARIASGQLPGRGRVTVEPGGQLELATLPHDGPRQLIDAIEMDTRVLARRFAADRLALVPLGLDPIREPFRTLEVARYEAMERYFLEVSPAGVRMMTLTASLQLNIDFGPDPSRTWERAHALAPVLAAIFANSPTTDGTDLRPISRRSGIWAATDPTRTRQVGPAPADWLPYVLDAHVMPGGCVDEIHLAIEPRPFRAWLDSPDPPTMSELNHHVTTLFPPVRPRGYLEFRMLDTLPAPGRAAAIAVVWALMVDDRVGELAADACRTLDDAWEISRQEGLDSPELRGIAATVLDAVTTWTRSADGQLADAIVAWRTREPAVDVGDLLGTEEPTA